VISNNLREKRMARRMFSDEITGTDAFLDMPSGSQLLYFHLGMQADDDGFISSPKMVMRVIGSSDDELKLLFLKKFLLPFESGVCVVKHWRINNQIRKDRYRETKYTVEKSQLYIRENGTYSFNPENAIPVPKGHFLTSGNQTATDGQPSIGKVSKGKESIESEVELPDFIDREVWNEWVQFRKEKKQKLTPTSIKRQLKFLTEHQKDYKAIIEASIQNGWTGLFALKGNQKKHETAKSGKYAKFDE
jgi:hypothetical protein